MFDPLSAARSARANLQQGLAALQEPEVVPELQQVAELIATAMGELFKIEHSRGATLGQSAPTALEAVRRALAMLLAQPAGSGPVDRVTEVVAACLGALHGLNRAAAPAPAAPSQAGSYGPAPQPAADPGYAGYGGQPNGHAAHWLPDRAAPMTEPRQVAWQQVPPGPQPGAWSAQQPGPAPGPAQQPAAQPGAWSAPQPQPAPPGPQPGAWSAQQPGPQPGVWSAQQPGPGAWSAPQPQAAPPGPQPGAWSAPQPQQSPWQGQSPGYAASPGPMAAQAQPAPQPAAEPVAAPADRGGAPLLIDAELGAHSPSNFYKGLSGNDVIRSGGIFVATYRIPSLGQSLILRVSLPGGYEFEAMGVVRWTRDARDADAESPPGFGAQFTQISSEGRQLVYRYVRNREPLFHDDL